MLRAISSLSLVAALTLGTGAVHAQQLDAASDGQQFQNQSVATQRDFVGIFGPACAPREWAWQHRLETNPDSFSGDPASDGQVFGDQDDDIQRAFVAWFGPVASDQWVAEHNAVIAHRVLLSDVAPVPCPPAATPVSMDIIGTRHLSDAVGAAQGGDLKAAADLFDAFRALWVSAKPKVTSQSPAVAQSVQDAFDRVSSLSGNDIQTQLLPSLQNLLDVVNAANATLGTKH